MMTLSDKIVILHCSHVSFWLKFHSAVIYRRLTNTFLNQLLYLKKTIAQSTTLLQPADVLYARDLFAVD